MSVAEEDKPHSHPHHVITLDNIDNGCPPRSSVGGGEGSSDEIVVGVSERERISSSECCVDLDLESVNKEVVLHLVRDCRICHLSMDMTNHDHESGIPIELGCSCKDDLAAAHKHCAEAWFEIKGDKTCEICGSIACNVAGAIELEMTEQLNEASETSMVPPTGTAPSTETRSFWQGHRFLNFLLACMVFAFVISWLFHFNVPS